jgi:hypothetical protein
MIIPTIVRGFDCLTCPRKFDAIPTNNSDALASLATRWRITLGSDLEITSGPSAARSG